MAKTTSIGSYARAVLSHWFTAMSGPLSVPVAAAAFWVTNDTAKVLLGLTAFVCAWAAGYGVWKYERKRVIELEEKLDSSKNKEAIIAALTTARDKIFALYSINTSSQQEYDQWAANLPQAFDEISAELGNVLPPARVTTLLTSSPKNLPSFKRGGFEGNRDVANLVLQSIMDRIGEMIERHS